jgi:FAD/FMN-containing dehydrogenase
VGGPTYADRVARLQEQYAAIPPNAPVRLAKRTSNLFRPRQRPAGPGLDVAMFDGVLSVDAAARTADVMGMTTYEHLVDATLPYGLMPLVVPQLKTITLGGAVTGLGIESSSFRNGLPHESVLDMDVLTGDGRVVTASATNEHADLYHSFPNSYGTLGYALRLRIELEPIRSFVHLRHERHRDPAAYFARVAEVCATRAADFVDGTVFGPTDLVLTLGTFVDEAPHTSDYTGMQVYYRSLQQRTEDDLTVRDYLWRWDTDWFWCSRAFGAQNPRLRRWWPKQWLRSDVYWKIVAWENRYGVMRRLDRLCRRPQREAVVQDVEVPIDRAAEFLAFFLREIPILPVWVCPVRLRYRARPWDLYPLDPDNTYVNFGFWSSVPLAPGEPDGTHNRLIERTVGELGGRKSLYSTAYYDEDDFWRIYNGPAYLQLKKEYDPDGRLLDLYAKCVQRR